MGLFDKAKLIKKSQEPVRSKPLVMVVDDEEANVQVLSTLLEDHFEVISALNGKEALDKVMAMGLPLRLRAVLADQRMPIMTGTEFLEKMHSYAPNVVRILITGYADLDSIMDSINKAHIYRYVTKPFERQDLLLTVERAVEALELKEAMERAEAEAKHQLERANEALSSTNRLKTLFLATISHELRTPMHGVVGNIELLNGSTMTADAKSYLNEARESALHMRSMLDDILLYTEIQSGGHKLNASKFSLHTLIDEICGITKRACSSKGLSFLCEMDPDVPANIRTDKALLEQVLRHIMSNAVKFTDIGGIKVYIGVTSVPTSEKTKRELAHHNHVSGEPITLRFRITDTGIGMSKEHQSELFESFNQINKKFNRRYGGLGLGLALCKELTLLFGGEISVESDLGKGSCFEILLPVMVPLATDAMPTPPPQAQNALKECHALVVDDNAVNRKVIDAMLTRLGCQTICATNGLEAVEIAENSRFDVILMDCQMPIMDGFEATEKIKKIEMHQRTPIIAFTANAAQSDREHARQSGMCDLLQKPVTLQQLSDCLCKWTGHQKKASSH